MLTEQQKAAIQAASLVLEMAGVKPWFEARIIRDSSKKLNGKRISGKKRTDLESVLRVVEDKRVNMLPDMRMELRMYATVTSSRSVMLGVELTQLEKYSIDQHDRAGGAVLPMLGVINVDDPRDPRHKEWGAWPAGSPEGFVEGRANFSASKNVERLEAEGAAPELIEKARSKVVLDKPVPPSASSDTDYARMAHLIMHEQVMRAGEDGSIAAHTCNTDGPMCQRESDGPFLTTCSICGDINEIEL